jgi:hypothetical protein
MSAFSLGDRYDWRGEKHGPWRRGTLQHRPDAAARALDMFARLR